MVSTTNGSIRKARHGHVITATLPAWGHAKAACALLSKIVRGRKVYATIITPLPIHEKVTKELARQFVPGVEDDVKSRVRVVAIEAHPVPTETELVNQNTLATYKKLVNGEPVEGIPGSGKFVEDVGPPQLFILDFFMYPTLLGVREFTGHSIPVYTLQSGAIAPMIYLFGPEELGGNGDLLEKFKPLMHLDEETKNKEATRIYNRIDHKLVTLPGLPPMYDYEHHPQQSVFSNAVAMMSAVVHRFFVDCDGMIMNNTSLEGPAIEACKSWKGEDRVICPAPFDFELSEKIHNQTPDAHEVIGFMDAMLEKYGESSIVYFSLGSIWWTTEPDKLWAMLDVIFELKIPFIFSHASPFAVVPPEIIEKIHTCGHAYESTWIPQTDVLRHKACGWFISHCGHNSINEALSAGVPLICWPFEADQPSNAANIAFTHNMGYELFEIRSEHGLLPVHRLGNRAIAATLDSVRAEIREVLTKAMGEDGRVKRANVLKFREELRECWKPGGRSWKEIARITDLLGGAGDKE